ncbi:Transmembrane domain-containing protein [Spironucleus salmonicida]|uniref:Transmembrane domain-containing protein n=1 Tax=Spironucleus salmonicida TaxID=348837 RepID=V6LMM4_9EUKA|nr:Transmembrane domain-containing protein [Spironucleus salmonicida]|eukprot:EST45880.1 Transmembrane domain-containing protein [Spironucleus salmonicida]
MSQRWHEKPFPYINLYSMLSLILSIPMLFYAKYITKIYSLWQMIILIVLPLAFHIIDIILCAVSRQYFRHPTVFWHIFGITDLLYVSTFYSSYIIFIMYQKNLVLVVLFYIRQVFEFIHLLRLTPTCIGVSKFSIISIQHVWSVRIFLLITIHLPQIFITVIFLISMGLIHTFLFYHGWYANCLASFTISYSLGLICNLNPIFLVLFCSVQVLRVNNYQNQIFERCVISLLFHEAFQKGLIGSINCQALIRQVILLQQNISRDIKYVLPKLSAVQKESSILLMNLGIYQNNFPFDIQNKVYKKRVMITNQLYIPATYEQPTEQLQILVDGNPFLQNFLKMRLIGADGIFQYFYAVKRLKKLITRFSHVNKAIFGAGFALINQSSGNQTELRKQFLQQQVTNSYVSICLKMFKMHRSPFSQNVLQESAIFLNSSSSTFINLPQFKEFIDLGKFKFNSIYWHIWDQLYRSQTIDLDIFAKNIFPFLDQRQINLFDIYRSQPLLNRVMDIFIPFLHITNIHEERQPEQGQEISNKSVYRPRRFHQFEKIIYLESLIKKNPDIDVNYLTYNIFKEKVINDMKQSFRSKKEQEKVQVEYSLSNIQKLQRLFENIENIQDSGQVTHLFQERKIQPQRQTEQANIQIIGSPLSVLNVFQISIISDIFLHSRFGNSKKQIEKFYVEDFYNFGQEIMGFWVQTGAYIGHPALSTSVLSSVDIIYSDFYRIVSKMQRLKRKTNNKDIIFQLYMLVRKFRFDKQILKSVQRQNKVINKDRVQTSIILTSKTLSPKITGNNTQATSFKSRSDQDSRLSLTMRLQDAIQEEPGLLIHPKQDFKTKSQFFQQYSGARKTIFKKFYKLFSIFVYIIVFLMLIMAAYSAFSKLISEDFNSQRVQNVFQQNFYKTIYELEWLKLPKQNLLFINKIKDSFQEYQSQKFISLCQFSQYQPCNSTVVSTKKTNQINVFNKYITTGSRIFAEKSQDMQSLYDQFTIDSALALTTSRQLLKKEQASRVYQFPQMIASYFNFFENYFYEDVNYTRQLLIMTSLVILVLTLYKTHLVMKQYEGVLNLLRTLKQDDVRIIVDSYQKKINTSIDKLISQAVIRTNAPTKMVSRIQSEIQTEAPSKQQVKTTKYQNIIFINIFIILVLILVSQFVNGKTFQINSQLNSMNMQLNQKISDLAVFQNKIHDIQNTIQIVKFTSNTVNQIGNRDNNKILQFMLSKQYFFYTLPSIDFYDQHSQASIQSTFLLDFIISIYNMLHLTILVPNPNVQAQKQNNINKQIFQLKDLNENLQDIFYYLKVSYQQIYYSQKIGLQFFNYNITADQLAFPTLTNQLTNYLPECQKFNGQYFTNFKDDQIDIGQLQDKSICILTSVQVQNLVQKVQDIFINQNEYLQTLFKPKLSVLQKIKSYLTYSKLNNIFASISSYTSAIIIHGIVCSCVFLFFIVYFIYQNNKHNKRYSLKYQENQFFQIKILRVTKQIVYVAMISLILFNFGFQIYYSTFAYNKQILLLGQIKVLQSMMQLTNHDIQLSSNPTKETNLNLNWYYQKRLDLTSCKYNHQFPNDFNHNITNLLNITGYFEYMQEQSQVSHIFQELTQSLLFQNVNNKLLFESYQYLKDLQLYQIYFINECDPSLILFQYEHKILTFSKLYDSIAAQFQLFQRIFNQYSMFFLEYRISQMFKFFIPSLFILWATIVYFIAAIYPVILSDFNFSVVSKKNYAKKLQEQLHIFDHSVYVFQNYKVILQILLQVSPILIILLGVTAATFQKKMYGFQDYSTKISLSQLADLLVNELEIYIENDDLNSVQSVALTLLNHLQFQKYGISDPCADVLQYVPSGQRQIEHPQIQKCNTVYKNELLTFIQNGATVKYTTVFTNKINLQLQKLQLATNIENAKSIIETLRTYGQFQDNQQPPAAKYRELSYQLTIFSTISLTLVFLCLSYFYGFNRQIENYIFVIYQMIQIIKK